MATPLLEIYALKFACALVPVSTKASAEDIADRAVELADALEKSLARHEALKLKAVQPKVRRAA